MNNKKIEYILVRDSFWAGVLGDAFMYGILLGMYWFNYNHLGDNGVLNIVFTLLAIMFIANLFAAKWKHTFYSYDEALQYLKSKAPSKTPTL